MPEGIAGVRALLRRAGDDAVWAGLWKSDANGVIHVLRATEVERAEEDFHLFVVGFFHRGSGCLARGRLDSDPECAATHLPDSDETPGTDSRNRVAFPGV